MRYERDEIHPVLWQATDDLNSRWMMGQVTEADLAVLPAHQRNWFQQYGRELAVAIGVPLALIAAGAALKISGVNPLGGAVVAAGIFAMVGMIILLLKRNLRQVSSDELAVLLPALKLKGIPQSYAEAVVAVGQANHVARSEKAEILKGLCHVMDEHERIEAARFSIPTHADLSALTEERQALQTKRSQSTDEETRRNYDQALGILDSRISHAQTKRVAAERLDAEAALLHQSLLRLTDSVRLSATGPAIHDLRDRLEVIQLHSQEVERAVAELDA